MKSKKLSLISLSILSLVLAISFVSAVSLTDINAITIPSNTSHDSSFQITFNLTNSGTSGDLNWTYSNFTSSQSGLTFSFDKSTIADGSSTAVTEDYVATITFDEHQTGTISGNVGVANDGSGVDQSFAFSVTILDTEELAVADTTMDEDSNTTTITITNEGNVDLTGINLTSTGDFSVSFSEDDFNLAKGVSKSITVTRTSDLNDEVGPQTVTITATSNSNTSASGTITTDVSFCGDCDTLEHLEIDINDITVKSGFGDEDDYWYPFDVIEAEIEVKNDGSYDMEDLEISWALYDDNGNKITDGEENDFNLDEDEDKTINLEIALDDDVDDLNGVDEVTLYVKVKGKIDDSYSSNDGEDTCAEDSITVDLITDDNFMIINDLEINGLSLDNWELKDEVACDTELQIVADVWNVGDNTQDNVYVRITNSELGISEIVELGDVDEFEYEKLEITLDIPEDAEEKYYSLQFTIYDEDDDIFETSEEEDAARFDVLIKVAGNCKLTQDSVTIAPSITSGGEAGSDLVVTTTIKNIGTTTMTYVINVKGYDAWASFTALDSNSVVLTAGESVEVPLTFTVKEDIEGDQTFDVEIVSSDGISKTQPVTVTITPQKSLLGNLGGHSWYIWVIGALNILLISAIIVVAVKVARE